MSEWISYNVLSQKWFDAKGDVLSIDQVQAHIATLRQERDDLQKRVKELENSIEDFLVTGQYTRNGSYERLRDTHKTKPKESPDEV